MGYGVINKTQDFDDSEEKSIIESLLRDGFDPREIRSLVLNGQYDEIGIRDNFIRYLDLTESYIKKNFEYIPELNLFFHRKIAFTGKTWDETHKLLAKRNLRMPKIEEFRRVLKYFKESPNKEFQKLHNKIACSGDFSRGPLSDYHTIWLDAYFKEQDGNWDMLTDNKTKTERLEDCLMDCGVVKVGFDSWVSEASPQGLPKILAEGHGDLFYSPPRNKAVATFYSSNKPHLSCCLSQDSHGNAYGVYPVFDGYNLPAIKIDE